MDRSKHSFDIDANADKNLGEIKADVEEYKPNVKQLKTVPNEDNDDIKLNLKFFNKAGLRSKNAYTGLPKLNSTSKLSLKYPNMDARPSKNSFYSPAQSNREGSK